MDKYDDNRKDERYDAPDLELSQFMDEEACYLEELKSKQDDFLDTYAVYLKIQNEFTKNLVQRKAIELEVIDPTFEFDI